jgi:opacity protein-like surface antigen
MLLGAAGAVLAPQAAQAQTKPKPEAFAPHAYVGLGVGQGKGDLDAGDFAPWNVEPRLATALGLPPGSLAGTLGKSSHELDIGARVFAGYRFHRHFALEAGYSNLTASRGFKVDYQGYGALAGQNLYGKYYVDAWPIAAVGLFAIPKLPALSVYGKAGAAYTTARLELDSPAYGSVVNDKKGKFNPLLGAGAQYDFGQHWAARLDYEWYGEVGDATSTGRAQASLFTLNGLYKF